MSSGDALRGEMMRLVSLFRAEQYDALSLESEQFVSRYPQHPFGWKVLGAALKKAGREREALEVMRRAVLLDPRDAETLSNLAVTVRDLGDVPSAIHLCEQAIAADSNFAQAYNNLATCLNDLGRSNEAETRARQAIALKPDYAKAFNNLGSALRQQGHYEQSIAAYKKSVELDPSHPEVFNNLGEALKDLGRFHEAEACYYRALVINPRFHTARSNYLFSLNYRSDYDPQKALALAKEYGLAVQQQAKQNLQLRHSGLSDRIKTTEPAAIRIGFVSGDLRQHPVGYFLETLLKHIDNSRFEIIAFYTSPRADQNTQQLRKYFRQWHSLFGLTDQEAASRVRSVGVDILFDLAGHTGYNRLPMFALRPAPVQVTWLGYFATTGVSEIDYILADRYVIPPHEEQRFVERVWRLPETYFCFTPPHEPIDVGPLPALEKGYLTFGCFNNLAKINDGVLALWANVLKAVPQSRLYLKTKQLSDPMVVQQLRHRCLTAGIDPARVHMEGQSSRLDYLGCYHNVDIALDPFPFPGGTTSVEGLWMGVPVVAMAGDRFIGHNGETIAHNAGLPDWVSVSREDYLRLAVEKAQDLRALAELRTKLRSRLLQSPLFDGPRFARHFQHAVQAMVRGTLDDAGQGN